MHKVQRLQSLFLIALLVTTIYAATAAPTKAFATHTMSCNVPDYFGYVCIDSNQVGGPTFDFVDISTTGTTILSNDDDNFVDGIPIGFNFNFYGTDYTTLAITSNGLALADPATSQYGNQPIGASDPNNFIAPLWDDLVTYDPAGEVHYQTIGDAPNRMFVAEWFNVQHFSSSPSGVTFEVVIKEGSNEILYQYSDVDFGDFNTNGGASATVGIEGPTGFGSQYSFDEPSLSNGLAILFTPKGVTITNPSNGSFLNTDTFTAQGIANDLSGISSVEASVDGSVFATATGTTTWTFPVGPLVDGVHTIDVNANTNELTTLSASSTFTIDTESPDSPHFFIPSPVTIHNPTISGTSEPNALIDVFDGTTLLGTTFADGLGDWSFITPFLPNGSYTINLSATDLAGNTSPIVGGLMIIEVPPATLYGATGADSSADLYGIDPYSGASEFIGNTFSYVSGIDFDSTGTLYGARDRLYTIDTTTGAATEIASTGTSCSDISFSPSGILYCIRQGGTALYTIDPLTGASLLVGNTGIRGNGGAISVNSSGIIFAGNSNGLYTLDASTGAATLISPFNYPPDTFGCRPNAFDFDAAGNLYGSFNCNSESGSGNNLGLIDTATAHITAFFPTVNSLDAIAFTGSVPSTTSIHILKFEDIDANGLQNQGEPTLSGWHFQLTNANSDTVCEGDTMVDDPITIQDETGIFSCDNIDTTINQPPYTLEETQQAGFVNTTPNPFVFTPLSSSINLKVGNTRTAEIHGMKWNDANGNAAHDSGESGVPGVEICISENRGGGESAASLTSPICTTTDAAGAYSFTGLLPGLYSVDETTPIGTVQTFPQFGNSWPVDLISGDNLQNIDFGNVLSGQINGMKWSDTNGDGIKDVAESGVSGVEIQLYKLTPPDLNGAYVTNIFTDGLGNYQFTNVIPGSYRLSEVTQIGASQTFPANGQPQFVQLNPGEIINGIDFGNTQVAPGSISGTKWNDGNANGIRDNGEPGVSGVQICLQPSYLCTVTDFQGNYNFNNVPVGAYTVHEFLPHNTANTTPIFQSVIVQSGITTSGIDFGNTAPTPPPPEVTIGGLSQWQFGSLPVIYWGDPTTYTKNVGPDGFDHCGTDKPVQVKLTITFPETNGVRSNMLTQHVDDPTTPADESEIWSTAFTRFYDPGNGSPHTDHGTASLRFDVDCPADTIGYPEDTSLISSEDEIQQGGNVYVDPSGKVLNACDDTPIEGAIVTLEEFNLGTNTFLIPDATHHIPVDNPQTTGADGAYGWVVIPGAYQVTAEKSGFVTSTTNTVTIPPAATDLNILLTPDVGCPVVNTPPVAVDDNVSTPEDTASVILSSALTANDYDADGDSLSVTAVSNPVNGAVSLSSGSITFTPNANFAGIASFDYTLFDGALFDTGLVTVTVSSVNDAPTISSSTPVTVTEDTPF
ncbi:MAG: carboxypeptidase regulatory-like domain-containing protein, partial [Nitrosopumilus sp.]|nr:carboxypeptidase regulatory-like domain-containing protein [Nitrosopumilus sp.]